MWVGQLSAPPVSRALTADNVASLCDGAFALFLDVDGTLLDLAERPSDILTPPGLVETLARAERKLGGALALVSGRPIRELDRVFEPLRLRASGVHGAELRLVPDDAIQPAPAAVDLPESLFAALSEAVKAFPGAFVENKRYSFAVHYRRAPAAAAQLRQAVMRVIESQPGIPVETMNAHCAIELKAPGCDKGGAVTAFLATAVFHGRTPIYIGDDDTDESGFAAVNAQGGYAYSVGRRRPGSIGTFSQPSAVRRWLAKFVEPGDGA